MTLTVRQTREVNMALRHLGRAMNALSRADLPLAQTGQSWLFELNRGERLVGEASDKLIDGLTSLAGPETGFADAITWLEEEQADD